MMNRYIVIRTQNIEEYNKVVDFCAKEILYNCRLTDCGISTPLMLDKDKMLKPL